ncbi:MAG: ATP-binding protein [Candidatus Bathyarchaeota archaeon]|nr:ATP-binding protein [Candidatus Bathyarchaeota archaeon]
MTDPLFELKPKNIYEIYGLSGNPFPATPAASPAGFDFFSEIRQEELKEIKDKFLAPSFSGEPVNLWVVGPRGVGKSVILLHVKSVLNERYGDDHLAIFVFSPRAGLAGIYKDLLSNLEKEQILARLSARLCRNATDRNPALISRQGDKTELTEDIGYYRQLLQEDRLDIDALTREVKSHVFERFPYVDLKIVNPVMEYIVNPLNSIETLRRKRSADILDSLIGLFHLLHLAGYTMIYLLIDQLELAWGKWTKRQKDRFAIDVRELVVRAKPLLSVEITMNEEIEQDIKVNYPALLRPLPMNPQTMVRVRLFDFPEIMKLVEWYLNKKRVDPDLSGLAPFDELALREIYERTARNTSNIINRCHGILRNCAQNKIKEISKEVLEEHMLLGEPIEGA